jgi:hypothetical protein
MRSPRIVVAILAMAMTASMAFTASSASARVDARPDIASQKAATSERAAAAITITSRVVKKRVRPGGPKKLVFQGKVTGAKGPVYIQKATKCNKQKRVCNFKFFRKVYLKAGAYHAVVGAPRSVRSWLWRAKVKNTYSEIWQTCTKRPTQECKIPY